MFIIRVKFAAFDILKPPTFTEDKKVPFQKTGKNQKRFRGKGDMGRWAPFMDAGVSHQETAGETIPS